MYKLQLNILARWIINTVLEFINSIKFSAWNFIFYPLAAFVILSIIYNILFKRLKSKNYALQYLLQKIRFLFYMYVIFIPVTLLVTFLPHSKYGLQLVKGCYWALILLSVVFVIEIFSTLLFDLFIIKKQKTGMPYLFKDLVKFTIYFILFLSVASMLFNINIQTLLTTSAVFSIILGLALQDTLGNLFSGLAMHLSKPYSIGDWIQVGANIGIVEKIDWRSTTIRTFTDDHITIPNSNISKVEIENFSTPTKIHARVLQVGVHYRHAPNKIKKSILHSVLETEGVLHDPFPHVFLTTFGDSSVNYTIWLWIDNFANYKIIESQVKEKIWYHFKRDGIEIPFPMRNVIHHHPETFEEALQGIVNILKRVDFLNKLDEGDLFMLAQKIKHHIFSAGEVLFRQGDMGKTFYIINSGRAQVTVKNACDEIVLVREMAKNDFFGEMSLLTGEPRSATVSAIEDTEVLILTKDDLKELLDKNEPVKESISKVLAERQIRTKKSIEECELAEKDEGKREEYKTDVDTLAKQIMHKITSFFSI